MSGDGRERGVIRLGGGALDEESPREVPQRRAHVVHLTKEVPRAEVEGRGMLHVNLNWSASAEADLDLGCMVLARDGSGTAVQPLGAQFGDLAGRPFVGLDQDDRTGETSDGETLRINLEHWRWFRKLLVYVYVYEGAVDFRNLDGIVTISGPAGTWRIHLDDSPTGAAACAVALLEPSRDSLQLRREVRWFTPHLWRPYQQRIDRAYGFGFDWTRGVKPPL